MALSLRAERMLSRVVYARWRRARSDPHRSNWRRRSALVSFESSCGSDFSRTCPRRGGVTRLQLPPRAGKTDWLTSREESVHRAPNGHNLRTPRTASDAGLEPVEPSRPLRMSATGPSTERGGPSRWTVPPDEEGPWLPAPDWSHCQLAAHSPLDPADTRCKRACQLHGERHRLGRPCGPASPAEDGALMPVRHTMFQKTDAFA
jgi:hypothetical protein